MFEYTTIGHALLQVLPHEQGRHRREDPGQDPGGGGQETQTRGGTQVRPLTVLCCIPPLLFRYVLIFFFSTVLGWYS